MEIEVKNSIKPVDYYRSMKILEKRAKDVFLNKKRELLWILEHNAIYTGGTSSDKKDIVDKKIKIQKTNRGGKYTCHGPGQKVVYIVLNLNKRKKDIRVLLNKIENCIIQILKEMNIKSFKDKKNIGIWVKDKKNSKKIAAIGIRIKKWVAFHGFALNINNDLSMYEKIIPCGIRNKGITSLKELGITNCKNINKIIIKNSLNIFH
ncbi:MAG: octanoyltransferase [Candidatus Pelagibacter sp. TMED64]|nr:octanoyltransferase [Candidatus Pelagibacter sp.]OUU67102.1 MAG: octanoyltransferase [Candidatus Pelagibacter sp. TMED64]|tara:strand:+ start:1599 stop:2216 length:618 start_codon:yes stop_codon:yes gene_type:complete